MQPSLFTQVVQSFLFFISTFVFTSSALAVSVTSAAQTISSGGLATGPDWSSGTWNNAKVKDGIGTSTSGNVTYLSFTTRLSATNFNFSSIPSNATIDGIEVVITRRNNNASGDISDNTVQLTLGGNNLALTSFWSSTFTDQYYGSTTNLWGLNPTQAQITTSTFGVELVVHRIGTNNLTNVQRPQVDYVAMTVSYSLPLPVDLLSFEANLLRSGKAEIEWVCASEFNSAYFNLYKSTDGQSFDLLSSKEAAGYSFEKSSYQAFDFQVNPKEITYYKLEQIDQDGRSRTYGPIRLLPAAEGKSLLFPNPATELITLQLEEADQITYTIINVYGQIIKTGSTDFRATNLTLDIRELPAGIYQFVVHTTSQHLIHSFQKR